MVVMPPGTPGASPPRVPGGSRTTRPPWGPELHPPHTPNTLFGTPTFRRISTSALWFPPSWTSHRLPHTPHLPSLAPRSNFCGDAPSNTTKSNFQTCYSVFRNSLRTVKWLVLGPEYDVHSKCSFEQIAVTETVFRHF